jgi:anthranilate phosphoribosyltransferase
VEANASGTRRFEISPTTRPPRAPKESLASGDAATTPASSSVLNGEHSPHRDVVLMNSALALVAAGRAEDFRLGVAIAADALDSGQARECLRALVDFTNRAPAGTSKETV